MYTSYSYYSTLYGKKAVDEAEFNRLIWNAEKHIDNITTCVNGVKKLQIAFPTKPEDEEAVYRCACALVQKMHEIEQAQEQENEASSLVTSEDGSVHYKGISSVNTGSESISFVTPSKSNNSAYLGDTKAQNALYREMIEDYLRGANDDNGINLLYAGMYPKEYL